MSQIEIEQTLRGWLDQAQSPRGQITAGQDPAEWVAERFIAWWRSRAEEFLAEGEAAAERLQGRLQDVLNWEEHGDALHEIIHVRDAFGDLRGALGLEEGSGKP